MKAKKPFDNSRRDFLRTSLGGFVAGGLCFSDALQTKAQQQQQHADHASVHGMALIGEKTLFLSHLPLFSNAERKSPHNYQVLLEAAFADAANQKQFVADRKQSKAKLYTIEPEKFVLTDLTTANGERARVSSFVATIYRDHFERGGTPIIKDARLTIQNVIHFRAFDSPPARSPKIEYLLFGKSGETYLAHRIVKPPDFDQLLAVKVSGVKLTDQMLQKGLRVRVPTLIDAIDSRLREQQSVACEIELSNDPQPKTAQARINALKEFYFETGDLAS